MKTRVYISTTVWAVLLLLLVVSFRPRAAFGQPRLELEQQLGCTGSEILVPINAANLSDVGSFSFFILVDTAGVEFVATENLFQGLLTGSLVSSITYENQPLIVINWFSMVPINLESGKLLDIRLKVKSSSCSLTFASNCELTKSDLSVIPQVVYTNGTITPLMNILPTPQNVKVTEARTVSFALPTMENVSYQWQKLDGDAWIDLLQGPNYLGIQEPMLTINAVAASPLDQYYRCRIGLPNCTGYSGISYLKVSLLGETNSGEATHNLMNVQSQHNTLKINLLAPTDRSFKLMVYGSDGKIVVEQQLQKAVDSLTISTIGWNSGLYMVSLYDAQSVLQTLKVLIL